MTRSVQCFVIFFVVFFGISPLVRAETLSSDLVISDRLVRNLSCENLNFANFKKAIRQDFTNTARHLPLQNYAIPFLGSEIANCWSLSRIQRLFFYLGSEDPSESLPIIDFLNIIRGSEPYLSEGQLREWPKINYERFWWPEDSERKFILLQTWTKSIYQELGESYIVKRGFKSDLESFQRRRFGDFIRNAKYIIRSGARSPRINRQTIQNLTQILDRNEVPLVIIRENRLAQHVVAIKSYQFQADTRGNKTIVFKVYDSNSPWADNDFHFSTATDHFYAPKIMTGLTGVKNPNSAMGVFLVDENERGYVLNSLFKKYQMKCSELKTAAVY